MRSLKMLAIALLLLTPGAGAHANFDDSTADTTLLSLPPLHGIVCPLARGLYAAHKQMVEIARAPAHPTIVGSCAEGDFSFSIVHSFPPVVFTGQQKEWYVHAVKILRVDNVGFRVQFPALYSKITLPFEAVYIETAGKGEPQDTLLPKSSNIRKILQPTRTYGPQHP